MLNGLDFFETPRPGRDDRRVDVRSHQDGLLFADMMRAAQPPPAEPASAQAGRKNIETIESSAATPMLAGAPPLQHGRPEGQPSEPARHAAAPAPIDGPVETVETASSDKRASDAVRTKPAAKPEMEAEAQVADELAQTPESAAGRPEARPPRPQEDAAQTDAALPALDEAPVETSGKSAVQEPRPAAEPGRGAQDVAIAGPGQASRPEARRSTSRAASDETIADIERIDGRAPPESKSTGQPPIDGAVVAVATVQTPQTSSGTETRTPKDTLASVDGAAASSPDRVSLEGAEQVQPAATHTVGPDVQDGLLSTSTDGPAGSGPSGGAAPSGAALATPGPVQASVPFSAANPVLQPQAPAALVAAPSEIVDIVTTRLSGDDRPDRIVVQLDPPELGRVSIEFKFDAQGLQQVAVRGETPEAVRQLRLLHFDLVQSLDQQGLSARDMTFSQGFGERGFAGGDDRPVPAVSATGSADREEAPVPAPAFMQTGRLAQPIGGSGLNIKL